MERTELLAAAKVAAGLLTLFVFVGILFPAPPAVLFLGLVLGSLSALVAMGLVLVYRANRIVNFAQGDMGAMASVLAASLIVGPKWPFFAAVAAGLAAALLVGLLVEVGIIRRFSSAPRLVLTVATIGVSQVLSFVQLGLPKLFDFDTAPQPPVPFDFTFEWFPVVFRGGHLLIIVTVPAVAIGLAAFFRRSRMGMAVRASAESAARAALLGVPVKRINTIVWVIAAGMSGVGVLLRLPIQGVQIGQVLGPSLLLRALAAAVLGRMESLPRTMAAAVAIGVMESAVLFTTGRTVIVDGVLLAVIIVALLVQRDGLAGVSRVASAGVETWGATREVRPIPRELLARREVRGVVTALGIALAAALVFVPLGWRPSQVSLFGVGVIMAIVICSLVLLTGWAGQISLGHLAILALGASIAGRMSQQGYDFFLCIAVAALAGAGISLAIGFPALRMRGPFFAVTTLAFATAMGTFILNREFFPWLVVDPSARVTRPVVFNKFDLESEHTYYLLLLLAFAFAAGVVWRVRNSRTGRALVGNRDNTRAVQAYGVDPKKAQLSAFALSGLLAGLAGGLYTFHQHGLAPGSSLLNPENSIMLFAMGVIGGLGSVPGAVIGAAYLTFVNFSPYTKEPLTQLLASGVGVLIVLMVFPSGLGGVLYDVRDHLLRGFARRRGILVPSLLADVRVEDVADETPVIGDATVTSEVRSLPSGDPLLVVRDLELSYGRTQVLFGVDFHVERGEIVALLGTNGAGKSTLLNAICGLARPSAGSVVYDGDDITGWGPNATVGAGIVMMPGGKGVFPSLTVAENITLAGWRFKDDQEHLQRTTDEALDMFPILRDRWDQKAGNLSGGQQQMLTLAQAFISKPTLLMIDELSLGLAPVIVQQLLEIVKKIHANGTTIVVVEQSVNVAITLAQRAVFLEKGEVRFDGPTADLLDRPEVLRAVFLEGAAAKRSAAAVAKTNGDRFVAVCDRCGHEHREALELRELSVSFGGVRAVDQVSLAVREQEIVGIIGPNGAGKTTVLDLISGFTRPSAGRVLLGGTDVTELDPFERAVLGLGRSFQDARLFPSMTVRQTIATALERHVPVRDPVSALVLSPAVGASERWVDEHVTRLVDLMRLGAYADKFVGELSTGTRRIVDLACSLAHDPDVLLLDEPSSGIAQRETEALGPVLLDIRDQTGAALVVIEHDMPLITGISDRLVALELGAVVAAGEPADVVTDPRVVAGYLGSNDATINRSGAKVPPGAPGAGGDRTDGARRRRAPLEAVRR